MLLLVGQEAAMAIRKMAAEMEVEIEKIKDAIRQGEEKEAEMIAKAREENNELSWRTYGEWREQIRARNEEAKRLEEKLEYLKKFIEEEEERKEA